MFDLELRLLDPSTDLPLYREAYEWRSGHRRVLPDRMSFESFTDSDALAIGLFNGELQAVYFLHEVEPRVFQAHFTSRPLVSVVHSCNDNRDAKHLQLEPLHRDSNKRAAVLSSPPCRIHAQLAQNSFDDTRTEAQRCSTEHSKRLPEAGQINTPTMREMWDDGEGGETPRRLQQTVGSPLALSSLPSGRTCNCRRVTLRMFHETLLAGAAEVAYQVLANGAEEIHAWVTPRNRPLRSFLTSLGFAEQCVSEFPCQNDTNGSTLPVETRNQRREFVKYVLKATTIGPLRQEARIETD